MVTPPSERESRSATAASGLTVVGGIGSAARTAPLRRVGGGESGVGVNAVDIVTLLSLTDHSQVRKGRTTRISSGGAAGEVHSEGVMTSDAASPMMGALEHRVPTSIV